MPKPSANAFRTRPSPSPTLATRSPAWRTSCSRPTQGRIPVTDPDTGVLVGLVTRKNLLQVRASVTRSEDHRRAYFTPNRRPMMAADH